MISGRLDSGAVLCTPPSRMPKLTLLVVFVAEFALMAACRKRPVPALTVCMTVIANARRKRDNRQHGSRTVPSQSW